MDDGNAEDIEGSDNRPRDGVVRDGKLDDVGGSESGARDNR